MRMESKNMYLYELLLFNNIQHLLNSLLLKQPQSLYFSIASPSLFAMSFNSALHFKALLCITAVLYD